MIRILFCIFGFLSLQTALALDYLKPGKRFSSPDKLWEVWVVNHPDNEDLGVEFFISARGSSVRSLLAQNKRHFGAMWSPDSKALLVYDNLGSGTSDAIVFTHSTKGWKKLYRTPDGFHIIWRLDEWLPDGVRLRSMAGGSEADSVPPTLTLRYDQIKPNKSED